MPVVIRVRTISASQTIRAPRKHPIKVGDRLYLYTGLRTKQARKLGEAECIVSVPVQIGHDDHLPMVGELCWASPINRQGFAENDGFYSHKEMLSWFEKNHGLPFAGHLIRWRLRPAEGPPAG